MIVALRTRQVAHDDDAPAPAIDERALDAATGIQRHAYRIYSADPAKAAPRLPLRDLPLLTSAGRRHAMGNGDARPVVLRTGALDALQYPSRMGDRLHWRDGTVTGLDGVPT